MKKLLYGLVIVFLTPSVFAAPFGNSADENLAREVWNLLTQNGWVGPDFAVSQPYKGATPHGETLDTIDGVISLQGRRAVVSVKKNYGVNDAKKVIENPSTHLDAVMVMVKMPADYDPQHKNWFCAKYKGNGSLDTNPAGVKLAGRVGKVGGPGCIGCHVAAPGGDFVFRHNRWK
jgi:hypothetical protein